MSERQILAEFGTGLCLAGLAPWAAPLAIPAAVLGAFLLDLREKCDKRLAQTAVARALKDLAETPDLTETDVRTAASWLKSRSTPLRLDPSAMAAASRTGDLPRALYDLVVDDTLARDGGARRAVELALGSAYEVCRTHPDYHAIFTQQVLIGLCQTHARIEQKLDGLAGDMTTVLAMLSRLEQAQPQAYAAQTQMIIGLAQAYAKNPDGTQITDFDTAYRGLENALRVALDMAAQSALPHNAADQVDAVLARVQALNNAAEFDAADAALADARAEAAERIAEQTSGLMRLWDSTVAQATLRNRPDRAAAALVQRLALDTPADHLAALWHLQQDWYVRGRDKGLAFDATVAIHLGEHTLSRAQTPDQRGWALNDLGIALSTLGEREPGSARLQAAVAAYTDALTERTQTRVPLQWAATHNNLGNVLATLGEREPGTARPLGAVAAYTEALKEYRQTRVPLDWALTQNNLGNALRALGEREPGTARLQAAVAAYTLALKEYTQTRVPLDWATTQNNLGNALRALGEREPGTARLDGAVAAYTEALKERTQTRVPLDWAATQNDLGNALLALGEREPGTARLEDAVAAYTEALKEYTQTGVPLDWATTQNNLGNALGALGEREPGTVRLQAAVAAYTEALKEYTQTRVPLQWAMTQGNLANVEIAFFDKTADLAHLAAARAYVMAANAVFVAAEAGYYVRMADRLLAKITAREAP